MNNSLPKSAKYCLSLAVALLLLLAFPNCSESVESEPTKFTANEEGLKNLLFDILISDETLTGSCDSRETSGSCIDFNELPMAVGMTREYMQAVLCPEPGIWSIEACPTYDAGSCKVTQEIAGVGTISNDIRFYAPLFTGGTGESAELACTQSSGAYTFP